MRKPARLINPSKKVIQTGLTVFLNDAKYCLYLRCGKTFNLANYFSQITSIYINSTIFSTIAIMKIVVFLGNFSVICPYSGHFNFFLYSSQHTLTLNPFCLKFYNPPVIFLCFMWDSLLLVTRTLPIPLEKYPKIKMSG